jgi:hypothetical protein
MKKKSLVALGLAIGMSLSMSLLSYASTFSEFWYQDTQGNWHIQDQNGNMVTNAWLCDDAVPSNGQNIWYLIDSNGNMVSAGLVQDQTGNIYSLETSHNGYYGMLRYQSGAYDGVYLDLESSHGGSFAKIKNQEGVAGLQGIYGLTQVNIDNSNCVYTSSFRNNGGYADNKQKTPETINIGGKTYYVSDYDDYAGGGSDFNPSQEFLDLVDETSDGVMRPGF